MPAPVNLVRSQAKIESLPTDDGSILDTIAGAIMRIFVRLNQIETEHGRIMRRLAAIEREAEAGVNLQPGGKLNSAKPASNGDAPNRRLGETGNTGSFAKHY